MSTARQTQRTVAPVIIIWTRYALQTALVSASIWRRHSPELWCTRQWRLQLLLGALVAGFGLAASWLNPRKVTQ